MPICPKCNKQRQPREKIVKRRGKEWIVESCRKCDYHFDINEWDKKHGKIVYET